MKYECTVCHKPTPRDQLTAKRVSYQTMGVGFKTLKSKITDWLCRECREKEVVWNAPKWAGTPGQEGNNIHDDGKAPDAQAV